MDMTLLTFDVVDLRNCCRVCLEEPHRSQMLDMNVIYDTDLKLSYYNCYEICTNDNLRKCDEQEPNILCKRCGVELKWAYDFHKKVSISKQQLKNMQNIVVSEGDEVELEDQEEEVEKDNKVAEKEETKEEEEEQEADEREEDEHEEEEEDALEVEELTKPAASKRKIVDTTATIPYTTVNDIVPRRRFSGQFNCQFCNKLFRNHSHMLKHRLIHMADRPQFQCSACDRIYLTKQALKVHVDTQHRKSGSACSICGKLFAIAKALEIHMRYHNSHFPFGCDQCDRKFAQRSHLNVHRQVQHSSARFLCEFPNCGKLFTSSSALHNHECIHTEMPFECNVCQDGFPSRYKLRMHAQRKHNTQLTLEQLETMRKFHVMRSKRVLAKIYTTPQHQEKE